MSAFEKITVSGLQPRDIGSFDLEWVLALVLLLLFFILSDVCNVYLGLRTTYIGLTAL